MDLEAGVIIPKNSYLFDPTIRNFQEVIGLRHVLRVLVDEQR